MSLNEHPILRRLPKNLDELAKETGAIKRRRNLRGGDQLLWLALTYAGMPESFRGLSAMAQRIGCHLNDTSIRRRLSCAVDFLTEVLNLVLFGAGQDAKNKGIARRICLQDATTVSAPGSKGTDWRLHTVFVLGQGLAHVEITDATVGENLRHGEYNEGDVVVADQGLATAQSIHHVRSVGAHCVVRAYLKNMRVLDEAGDRLETNVLLDRADQGITSHAVLVPLKGHQSVRGRLLVYRLPPEQAARNRQKLRQKASRKQNNVGEMGLRLAGYFVLFTTVPEADLSDEDAAKLYRLRWQIELFFKRCKSIAGLDKLAAKTPDVARAYLLAKLIIVALTERASMLVEDELRNGSLDPRLSAWRLHTICREDLMVALRQVGDRHEGDHVARLRAHSDGPRKRETAAALIEIFNRRFNPGLIPPE